MVVNEVAVIVGIAAIIIFTIIAYYLIHQFRNYLKSKKAKETVEANLDILLHDIEDFIKKWRVTRFLRPSYRNEIQRKSIGDSRFMVRNHANAIRSSTKGVKVLVNPNENHFTSLDEIVTAMANLGLDIEQVFETVASIKQTSESKFNEMVSIGDVICVKFRNIIPELEELKNRIP
jgi:methyl-accepting chemotaxis protein